MPDAATLPQALTDALPTIQAAIGPSVGASLDATAAARLARAGAIIAHRYAPGAPVEILTEAAIRVGGWLAESRPHAMSTKTAVPDGTSLETVYASPGTALRRSGARWLLSTYRVRRMSA